MPEPSTIEQATKWKDSWELLVGIGTVTTITCRWIWNVGKSSYDWKKTTDQSIASLKEQSAKQSESTEAIKESVSAFKDQSFRILDSLAKENREALQRRDEGNTATLQGLATVHAELKSVTESVGEIRQRCYGDNGPACERASK